MAIDLNSAHGKEDIFLSARFLAALDTDSEWIQTVL